MKTPKNPNWNNYQLFIPNSCLEHEGNNFKGKTHGRSSLKRGRNGGQLRQPTSNPGINPRGKAQEPLD